MCRQVLVFIALVLSVLGSPVQALADDAGVDMWRLYNPWSGEHLYSTSKQEYDALGDVGWKREGVAWVAPTSSSTTVYRLYNPWSGDHHYTTSRQEYDALGGAGWRQEGRGWYSDDAKRVAVYRLFNPYAKVGTHHYTTSRNEYDTLGAHGWRQEGIAWYGSAAGRSESGVATPSSAGALKVSGARLVSQSGETVQLRGVSTHGLAWFGEYVNDACFSQLRNDWGANVVRLAMYTQEYGGYCSGGNQQELRDLVRRGVEAAENNDLYVIVDWHILSDGNPLWHVEEAKEFFSKMSSELKGHNNVLYEICNEPNGGTSWADVKSYAEQVIPQIRANDPDAVVLVGTPTWSQEPDKAAADPLSFGNVMYTMHFYAATHRDDLRNRLTNVVQAGLPVFVSEFGICDASGNGTIDEGSADTWLATMNNLGVSWCMWSLCNKAESASVIQSGCTKTSGFTQADLTTSGQWLLRALRE